MRVLYRIAILFALLVPLFAKADTTSTLDHSRNDRSFRVESDSVESASGMSNRASRITTDFTSRGMFEDRFDQEAGRPFRDSVAHVNLPSELHLLRSERDSRAAAVSTAVTTAPEPNSLALLLAGLEGCASLWRPRRSC